MKQLTRSILVIIFILGIQMPVRVQAAQLPSGVQPGGVGPTAVNALKWYDGLIQYSSITNCVSIIQGLPYQEAGAGTFAGFLADPNAALPGPNQVYYLHVYIAGMGNSCSGMRVYLDIALPANTSLAIDGTNKVYCLLGGAPISPASDCPQTLPDSPYNPGAYAIYSTDSAHANLWPLPQGGTLEFQVPVKTSTALSNSLMQANVWVLDGNSSPWLRPQEGVYVFSSQPTILYPSPATTLITKDNAHSEAYLYTHGLGGTGYFDLGTTTSYSLIHDPVTISAGGNAFLAWDDWGIPAPSLLAPDTLYHWRFTFTPTAGSTVYGPDQTFRTLPDGRATVGQGATADCSEAALNAALATATKDILFNCGLAPVTITLTSPKSITSNLILDGGNLVTLAFSGAGNHFNVQNGAHLTLSQITLSNGNHTSGCGGAIYVASGGLLTVNKATFDQNSSSAQGGAICNWGSTDITNTQFTNNSSTNMGGAIGNYAALSIANSTFTGNSASVNGGAIDMGGTVTVANSTFSNNSASARGGGINAYGGNLTVTNSTFTGNSAVFYGGGLANDSSTTIITNSTFSGNSTPNGGGGIEDSGANTLTILNSTIANNTAGSPGGNIAAGTASPNVHIKNTLIANGSPNNCDAAVASQGYNLESANTCGLAAAGDKINLNPQLGPLQNNGGASFTLALLPGSPAIDAGTNTGRPATDQRGVTRPQGAGCDIGAYESRGFTLTQTGGSGQSALFNTAFAQPLSVTLIETGGAALPGGTITFSAPASGAGANLSSASATTNSSGIASVNATANNTVGSYQITASAPGGIVAAPFTLINLSNLKANTTTTLVSSANPSNTGNTLTLTATVSSSGTPAGTVAFKDGGAAIPGCGSQVLNGSGQATCTLALGAIGTHNLSAEYGGAANYNPSVSPIYAQVVNQARLFLPGIWR